MIGATLPTIDEGAVPTILAPTREQFALLQRLASLIGRQDRARDTRKGTDLARAVFSAYLDCVDLGVGDEAERLLTRDPLTLLLWQQGQQH
jgi:hypothetical protein